MPRGGQPEKKIEHDSAMLCRCGTAPFPPRCFDCLSDVGSAPLFPCCGKAPLIHEKVEAKKSEGRREGREVESVELRACDVDSDDACRGCVVDSDAGCWFGNACSAPVVCDVSLDVGTAPCFLSSGRAPDTLKAQGSFENIREKGHLEKGCLVPIAFEKKDEASKDAAETEEETRRRKADKKREERRRRKAKKDFNLKIETCNATSWSAARAYLKETDAHIVLMQEHHLAEAEVAEASNILKKMGWKSLWTTAVRSGRAK